MSKKIVFGLIIGMIFFLSSGTASLAADPPPAFNALCWKQKECESVRKSFGFTGEGWVKGNPPCAGGEGEDAWGMCLPSGKTVTEIAFGGSKSFANIGDFIVIIYRYAVGVASILAVAMIIVAGAQWVTSGGNSETINSAKKRIMGAIVGLFIAYMSNFILSSINPALINLRLPQSWMVKKQSMVPEFCSESPDKTVKYAQATDTNAQTTPVPAPSASLKFDQNPFNDNQKKSFWCGKRFYMEGGGTQTCWGDYCDAGQMCYKNGSNIYGCVNAFIAGKIDSGFKLDESAAKTIPDRGIEAYAICKNSTKLKRVGGDPTISPDNTSYSISGESKDVCGGKDNTIGYFIGVLITDCSIGGDNICLTSRGSQPDWFAVGRSPGSNSCNTNLAFTDAGSQLDCSKTPRMCSCYAVGGWPDLLKIQTAGGYSSDFINQLITYDEIQKGFRCNISIDRSVFPGLDNNVVAAATLKGITGGLIPNLFSFMADKAIESAVTTRCDGE